MPFLKLAPQRCRRLRAASDIAPALGHHAHPGPGHRAGQPLPPAPRPPPAQPGPAQPPRQPNAAAASRQRRPAREAAPAAPARAIATEAEALRARSWFRLAMCHGGGHVIAQGAAAAAAENRP